MDKQMTTQQALKEVRQIMKRARDEKKKLAPDSQRGMFLDWTIKSCQNALACMKE